MFVQTKQFLEALAHFILPKENKKEGETVSGIFLFIQQTRFLLHAQQTQAKLLAVCELFNYAYFVFGSDQLNSET